jgi:hypothetical protein
VAFFVVLAGLSVLAVVLPILYNLRQQLRPEDLARARELWRERGPADYELDYTLMIDRAVHPERYAVLVRGGRVVFAGGEGRIEVLDPDIGVLAGPSVRGVIHHEERILDVPGLFDRIESVLQSDPQAGKRNLTVAAFDPRDGHPRRFIHRVRGTDQREEWIIRLYPR